MLFFELLQVAIGDRTMLSCAPTAEEWRELYLLAQKQAMVGIAFRGVEQLPEAQRPPKALLVQWMMATERIKAMNADMDRKAVAVAGKFRSEGFPGVVLKGQGVARLYRVGRIENSKLKIEPEPAARSVRNAQDDNSDDVSRDCCPDDELSSFIFHLSSYRTPGDIDIWLHGERKEILRYVRQHVPDCKPVYHHVDFPVINGLDIEVHFTPSWMNSPITNRRLQRWFRSFNFQTVSLFIEGQRGMSVACDDGSFSSPKSSQEGVASVARRENSTELPMPSLAFNRVYILVHIYRHLFHEGIGLRQLLDYYFVLCQGFTEEERAETMCTLRSLKMERFAAAVMWVLQEVYGMDDRYLLTKPDEKEGRFLLGEIMLAGNFGHYDDRMQHERGESALHWGLRKVKRNFRFVRSYPSEVLWSPLFKLWHWFWRKGLGCRV